MHLAQPTKLLRWTARLPTILNTRQTALFSDFSPCAQDDCLQPSADSTTCLSDGTEEDQYSCLCNDNSFITSVAQCTFTSCGSPDLEATANTWVNICDNYGTPSVLDLQEIVNAGVGCEFDTIPSTTHILQSITSH
jgi:hypothetical protein